MFLENPIFVYLLSIKNLQKRTRFSGGGRCTVEIHPCGDNYNLHNAETDPEVKEQLLKKVLLESWKGCANVLKMQLEEAERLKQMIEGASTTYVRDLGARSIYGDEYDHKVEAGITGDSFAKHLLIINPETGILCA